MSRKAANKSRPSYPRDADPHHRAFIIRSLDKCDHELAVVSKLNRTLHTARKNVVEQCGERVLLDLGRGKIQLASSRDELVGESLPPEQSQRDVCVDFLLRMKLRRRLLNRLARRLNRVAHAMDGEDVAPTPQPKYGDLRLHVDPEAVRQFRERLEAQEQAKKRIEAARKREETKQENAEDEPEDHAMEEAEDNAKDNETDEAEEKAEDNTMDEAEDIDQKEDNDQKENNGDVAQDAPKQEMNGESRAPAVSNGDADNTHQGTNGYTEESPETVASVPTKEAVGDVHSLAHDYDICKEYKDGYEKILHKSTGETEYTLLQQEVEEDYVAIKYGAGIGAVHRSMSLREKENEYKRWQHTLLTQIPEQPTFEDLGLEHRVFKLEERLALLTRDDDKDRTPKKKNTTSPSKKAKTTPTNEENEDCEDVEPMDLEESDGKDDEKKDEEEEEEEEETENDEEETEKDEDETEGDNDDDEDYSDENDGKKKGKKKVAEDGSDDDTADRDNKDDEDDEDSSKKSYDLSLIHQKRKIMSLSAVPSFYDQDMRRLRLIHADLMATSTQEHARELIAEAAEEYNATFRKSNALYNERVKIQSELNSLLYQVRVNESKRRNDYALEVAIARSRWQKQLDAINAQKLVSLMPAYSGRIAVGTPVTAAASARPDTITAQVGQTMSNVVDAVVTMQETGWKSTPIPPFLPPPPPALPASTARVDPTTGENMDKKRDRIEAALRAELSALSSRLHSSEEERKRAWRKLQKTRADVGSNLNWTPGKKGRSRVDHVRLQHMPVPALRASVPTSVPPAVPYTSSIPAYIPPFGKRRTPTVTPGAFGLESDSKYSVAKVKERISSDGTVAPVTQPKRTKDGLYQRPAGRTRKGMEWDAVRGIWVPA